ncbi:MAG: hypothetical protein GTO14_13090 [Anaerolineales bacterium]|nr:hypothetical protein [Anaerolineales bacterium]
MFALSGWTPEEMITAFSEQTPLGELPSPVGNRRSPGLEWDVCSIELTVPEIGNVWAKAALVTDEAGSYVVSVQSLKEQNDQERALHEMLFNYALYNTRLIE